jgi:hypothetical protein
MLLGMRPYQTVALLIVLIAGASFLHFRNRSDDSRIELVANCYVELALLQSSSDTTDAKFTVQKDSVLNSMGFTELSFRKLKADLEREPEKLIEIWDLVEKKLKARKEALDIIKP